MNALRPFHDDTIIGYEVDCDKRSITLYIRPAHWREQQEVTRIKFSGVAGYHFKDDAFSNVIMQIEEVPADTFIARFGAELAESFRTDGTIGELAKNDNDAQRAIRDLKLKAIVIESVMGLNGWLIAKDFAISI